MEPQKRKKRHPHALYPYERFAGIRYLEHSACYQAIYPRKTKPIPTITISCAKYGEREAFRRVVEQRLAWELDVLEEKKREVHGKHRELCEICQGE